MNEYQEQAMKFLADTGATITSTFKKYGKHFSDDKTDRDIYSVTITRGARSYTFDFGQSINNSGLQVIGPGCPFTIPTEDYLRITKNGKDTGLLKYKLNMRSDIKIPYRLENFDKLKKPVTPTEYDILACLTKYDPGDFSDFCGDFGYDEDSRTAEKTWRAVRAEYENLVRLFNDEELESMGEIQ